MINSNLTLIQTPSKYCLVAGKSEGFTKLNAFDGALLNAGVGNTNLVKMSSILPPNCEEVESFILPYGALVPVAYAATESAQENHLISSAVAIAIPKDSTLPGVIMEFSSSENAGAVEKHVRRMAEEALHMRGWEIKEVKSISIEHNVEKIGATFAGVVLWQ